MCNEVVERENLVRGADVSKGEYVQLTEAELDSIEAEVNGNIDLREFVPLATVDPVYFDSSYFLGPEKGGEKSYRLLADALAQSQKAAVAQLVSRGKEHMVIIRPYNGGMILHGMYYANEMRDFKEVPRAQSERVKQLDLDLGAGLVDRMANDKFEPTKYRDEYRLRVEAMLNEKVKGHKITAAAEAPHKSVAVIDLMEALKRSIGERSRTPATRAAVRSKVQKSRRDKETFLPAAAGKIVWR